MKKLMIPLTSLLLLLRSAQATAIYDVTNSVTLRFSQPWVSVAPNTVPSPDPRIGPGIGNQYTNGTGSFTAYADASNRSSGNVFTQTNRAWGSAGNTGLDQSGFSSAGSFTFNLFTFDFGSTPTDFTVDVLDWAYGFGYTLDQPRLKNSKGTGESLGGSVGYQLVLDDDPNSINYTTDSHPFYDLTGVHTFRFGTFAETSAAAIYPFEVPETGSSLALLFISLSSLSFFKFNGHRATRMARGGG